MSQAQATRSEPTPSRLKSVLWGRQSLTMAFVIYASSLFLGGGLLMAPLTPWLSEHLGSSRLGFVFLFMALFSVPFAFAGWVTARLTPLWCLVPWVAVNVGFIAAYILPQLQKMAQGGDWWQFWQLALGILTALALQPWVLLTTRRRVIHRLSTGCG